MRILASTAISLAVLSGASNIHAGQSPTASSQEASCSITGRVTIENEGAPDIPVVLQPATGSWPLPPPVARATTDKEGLFKLNNLAAGRYYLIPLAAAYFAPSEDREVESGKPITLVKGENLEGIELKLIPGGVITGRVTTAGGYPVIDRDVYPILIDSRVPQLMPIKKVAGSKFKTDDRGVYRFFGIRPGSYLVRAGGRGQQAWVVTAFDSDAPTYHPSAPRESATEIKVRAGDEATGIDIRYRGEIGYAIRGVVTGATDFNQGTYLLLNRLPGGAQAGFMYARAGDKSLGFDFEGLPDGEYELIAERRGSGEEDDGAASPPRRVTIKGADVNEIEMRLVAFSSISGRIVLAEGTPQCQSEYRKELSYASPIAHREGATRPAESQGRLNEQGEFTLRRLEAGRHRLAARLYNDWYLRSITQSGPAPARRPIDVSREVVTLCPGERKTGLIITVAEGAALLVGRVIPAKEGDRLPTRLRAHLVPAEPASADDALRYAETAVRSDGSFSLSHIPPGRYWLLARAAPDEESSETPARPAAWDTASRAKLWREARAAKVGIELQACQRVTDYVLRYESRD